LHSFAIGFKPLAGKKATALTSIGSRDYAFRMRGKADGVFLVRRASRVWPAAFRSAVGLFVFAFSFAGGPPFYTDDPDPVKLHHWEFYLASAQAKKSLDYSGTAPHFEVNYGVAPNVQLHVIAATSFDAPKHQKLRYGWGDTEIGLKYRFVEETDGRPQIGTFPQIEVPTGASSRGLGGGNVRIFLPIWVQKSWGEWTSYGGGGYCVNPGPENKDYWWFGWEVQRDVSKAVTLGAEIFTSTATARGESTTIGLNWGAIVSLGGGSAALVSIGRDIRGPNTFFMYAAYYLTFGPRT
jgi:hypothetical protein